MSLDVDPSPGGPALSPPVTGVVPSDRLSTGAAPAAASPAVTAQAEGGCAVGEGSRPFVVVALSGGLDSTTLLARYAAEGQRLLAVSVDYGQRHARELDAARAVAGYFAVEHLLVDLRSVGRLLTGSALTDATVEVPDGHYSWPTMTQTIVPNRNTVIASVLVAIGISRRAAVVALGMHAGDHAVYPDCRPAFVEKLRELVLIANENEDAPPPRVEAPFITLAKSDIVRVADQLAAPVALTWSCYRGGPRHCGVCGTCYERREAFTRAGVMDPTTYDDATTSFPATGFPGGGFPAAAGARRVGGAR